VVYLLLKTEVLRCFSARTHDYRSGKTCRYPALWCGPTF